MIVLKKTVCDGNFKTIKTANKGRPYGVSFAASWRSKIMTRWFASARARDTFAAHLSA